MKLLLNKKIQPKCEYCQRGSRTKDGTMILCVKKGIVALHYKCRKFKYDPLLRDPQSRPELPKFDPSDFEI